MSTFSRQPRRSEILLFMRQLATLLATDVTLPKALATLQKQTTSRRLTRLIEHLYFAVNNGDRLSAAMQSAPAQFEPLTLSMVRAGEASGTLDDVLGRVASTMEKSDELRRKLLTLLIYPCCLLAMSLVVLVLLVTFLVPRFQALFQQILPDTELPFLTRSILGLGQVAEDYRVGIVIFLGCLVALFIWLPGSTSGRRILSRLTQSLPLIGNLRQAVALGRWARAWSTLLHSGVGLLPSLRIASEVSQHHGLRQDSARLRQDIEAGVSIHASLQERRWFPPMVVSMVEVGEETGQLTEVLQRIAERYEAEAETAYTRLTTLLEPALIICMALLVGTIIVALFQPIISLIRSMAGG